MQLVEVSSMTQQNSRVVRTLEQSLIYAATKMKAQVTFDDEVPASALGMLTMIQTHPRVFAFHPIRLEDGQLILID